MVEHGYGVFSIFGNAKVLQYLKTILSEGYVHIIWVMRNEKRIEVSVDWRVAMDNALTLKEK